MQPETYRGWTEEWGSVSGTDPCEGRDTLLVTVLSGLRRRDAPDHFLHRICRHLHLGPGKSSSSASAAYGPGHESKTMTVGGQWCSARNAKISWHAPDRQPTTFFEKLLQ